MHIFNFALSGFAGNGKTTTCKTVSNFFNISRNVNLESKYKCIVLSELADTVFKIGNYFDDPLLSNLDNYLRSRTYQYAILCSEMERLNNINNIISMYRNISENKYDIIFLHDRSFLDNIVFSCIHGIFTVKSAVEFIRKNISNVPNIYDKIYIIGQINNDEFISKIINESSIRKKSLTNFYGMQEMFYMKLKEIMEELELNNYVWLPHPIHSKTDIVFNIIDDIVNTILGY